MSQSEPRVKICGVRTPEDALAAAQAGADFVGLAFVPGRLRRVDVASAKNIVAGLRAAMPHPPQVVGLFADQPLDEVNETIHSCDLDVAQLCGQEPLDYCRSVEAGVIKVLHVDVNAGQTATDSLGNASGVIPMPAIWSPWTGLCRESPEALGKALTGMLPPSFPGGASPFCWREG